MIDGTNVIDRCAKSNTLFVSPPKSNNNFGNKTVVTTYSQGQILCQKLTGWIANKILQILQDALIEKANEKSKTLLGVEVLVAFLSGNSPQAILSLIACLGICFMDESSYKITFLPVLLNARWTAKEVTSVLSCASDDNIRQSCMDRPTGRMVHITLLLNSKDFESVAVDAVRMIEKTDKISDCIHLVRRYTIPSLIEVKEVMDNDSESLTRSCQIEYPKISYNSIFDSIFEPKKCYEFKSRPGETTGKGRFMLLFTSGTTSKLPKGVLISLTALMFQSRAKQGPPCNYSPESNMVMTVPFFHIGGLSSIISIVFSGGTLVFPSNNDSNSLSFDPSNVVRALGPPYNPSIGNKSILNKNLLHGNTLVVVPAMLHSLLDRIDLHTVYPGVKLVLIGGQSASEATLFRVRRAFPRAKVVQTYACTEACSSISFNDVTTSSTVLSGKMGGTCVGTPSSSIKVGIFPLPHLKEELTTYEDEQPLITFQPFIMGFICTGGPHIMSGYWYRNPRKQQTLMKQANKDAFPMGTKGFWLKTNDLGYLDELGRLHFCGRAIDVIRTGGETVFPTEVEETILSFKKSNPVIDSCAVFPLPDPKFGEVVSAAIVLIPPHVPEDVSLEELRRHCKEEQLAGYKCPRRLFFLSALPTNSSGKVLRHELIEMYNKYPLTISKI